MARPLRIEFPGALYHLTGRGNARADIYLGDGDRAAFVETLAGVVERYSWLLHAYCLMDNHYHLMVETPEANLSRGMRQLNGVYTQRFNRSTAASGTCSRGATRPSWWRRRAISWNSAATWSSTRSAPAWFAPPRTGGGAATGRQRA